MITVRKDDSDRIMVSFPYDSQLVEKVRTIEGCKWHKDEKYWSFPNTDGTLEKILEVFKGEEIHIDPILKSATSKVKKIPSPLAGDPSTSIPSPLVGEGEGYNFEDLRRELVSRKYSYKTVKG